jgi:environmental stress-induced protein Ves
MPRTVITPTLWHAQPWKNGRGTTNEIARWPPGIDDRPFEWRISIAEVTEPGPFSTFRGYVRWTYLLEGDRIGLSVNKDTHWLVSAGSSTRTAGGTPMTAHLPAGPVRLLNVLAKHNTVEASTTFMRMPVRLAFACADCPELGLARWDSILFDPPELVTAGSLVCLVQR